MKYQFKNITFNFTQVKEEFTGENSLIIPFKMLKGLFEEVYGEDIEEERIEELSTLTYDEDQMRYYFEEDYGEDFYSTNPDFQIVLYKYLLDEGKDIELDCEGSNIFWFFHDCYHALRDVSSGTIYVDAPTEEERIFQALDYMKEIDEIDLIPFGFFEKIEEEFNERWAYPFDTERVYDYFELEEEY